MKKSQVKSNLKRLVAWDQEPVLTEDDLNYLVDRSRTSDLYGNYLANADEWEPVTSYAIGDQIITASGVVYVCTTAGVSGVAAPVTGTTVEDGSVTWTKSGTTNYRPTYDLNKGAYEGWGLKAAKAASMISFSSDNARFERDQYMQHCEAMQRKFPQLGSLRTAPRTYRVPMILEVVKDVD